MKLFTRNRFLVRNFSLICSLLIVLFFSVGKGWGQSSANYTFTFGSSSLNSMTGSTSLMTGVNDDAGSTVFPIGFNFIYMGTSYSHISVNSNGQARLHTSSGASAIGGSNVSSYSLSTVTLAPMAGDNEVGNGMSYLVSGSAPNRKLIIEWNNFYAHYSDPQVSGNMQLVLYETTGVFDYIYGNILNSSTSSVTRSIFHSSSNTANASAFVTVAATPTVNTSATSPTTNSFAASVAIANLANRMFTFTPLSTTPNDPIGLTFSAVTATTTTSNWVDNSSGETFFIVTRATDAGFTTGVVVTNVASTTNIGVGNTYTLAHSGLTPSITYYYKIQSANEGGVVGSGLTGSQSTTAAATYYYVGAATGSDFSTAASWNTNADGSGTNRTVAATTDILIIDGIGTSNTAGGITIAMAASQTLGALQITNSTAVTIQSSATTQRILTLTGSVGDELSVGAGSSILLTNITNSISIVFAAGTGMTGTIAGTLTVAGVNTSSTSATANSFLTTGGTGTIVTVTSTGVINNIATTNISTNGNVTGTTTSLVFANGSQYNVSGATTGAPWIPLATWGSTSTISITGITTATSGPSNASQSFGNFVYNCPSSTATFSCFTSSTVVIQGDLTITSTGTGIFRALTLGTLTINGNVNINGGRIQPTSSTGTFIVLGSTIIGASGTLDQSAGSNSSSYSQRGNTFTNNGTIVGSNATPAGTPLNFFSPTNAAMVFDGTGTISTVLTAIGVQTTGGLTINHANQIPTLRVNLFNGVITNSNKITIGTGAALACVVQTGYTANTLTSGSFDQLPTFSLGTGSYSVIYSQESANRNTGFEIPSTRVISNITLSNSNGITVAGGALSSAALTFSTGCGNITTSSSNVLSITGTATTAITRTSTTAYVNGPLELTLPANLVSGSTYLFPVGKTSISIFELINPTTNAGGSVVVRAEAFDGNSGGTAGNILASINSLKYWGASISSGSSNFTNSNIRLTAASTTGFDAIGNSSTVSGAYGLVGGVSPTITSTTIASTSPLTSISGFYLMGTKAAAALSSLSITPSGNQCSNVSRAISVLVTPGGGAVTGVSLNYSINGVAQTAIAMTNSTNNGGLNADTWTGTIPIVTPVNASVTWSVTATDVNSLMQTISGTGYADAPNTGATATATATPATVCAGNSTNLSIGFSGAGSKVISSALTATTASSYSNPIYSDWSNNRSQILILGSELSASGMMAGNINSMSFTLTSTSTTSRTGYTIKIGATTTTALTTSNFLNPTFTTVYSANYTPVTGANTFLFSTPFVWDGTSNIVIETCWDNTTSSATLSSTATAQTTSFNSVISYNRTSTTGTSICGATNTPLLAYTSRPLITLSGSNVQLLPTVSSFSWSDGSSTIGTTNPLNNVTVTGTPTYTCTATVNNCPMTASVTPTVNPLPTAPSATNSTQCGSGIPSASVSDNNSYSTPTFKWYNASTGGTVMQSSTSTTYTTSISQTTTFYVAVADPSTGCESVRTAVTVTVYQPDAISASTSASTICIGQSVTLTAANTASSPTQNYTYSWSNSLGNGASVSASPTTTTTYTVTGTDGLCNVTNTVTVTVNPLSVGGTASAALNTLCVSGSTTITLTGNTGTIQWQSSTDNSNFTNVSGQTASTLTTGTISNTSYYRAVVTSGVCSSTNSSTATVTVNNPQVLTTTPGTICSNLGSVPLSATASAGATLNWYASSSGGTSLGTGTTFNTPNISTSTTYYVQSSLGSSVSGAGKTTYAATSGNNSGAGLLFTANQPFAINTVDVYNYSTTSGSVTIQLQDGNSNVINSVTVSISAGSSTPSAQTISLGLSVPSAGSYKLMYTSGSLYLGRESSGVNFPFSLSTFGSITNGSLAGYYYYFYNWSINNNCNSSSSPVLATLNTPNPITPSASQSTICNGATTTLSVSSGNSGYAYSWSNGLGSGASVTASPTSNTTYTVTATDNSNGCVNTASVPITVNPVPTAISLTPSTTQNLCAGNIQVITASGGSGGSVSNSSSTNSSGSINLSIPDFNSTGVASTLAINNIPTGASISKIEVNFNLTHAWLQDAEITLKAPNGKTIALAADQGPSGTGSYTNCTITSDNTAAALSTSSSSITGTYKANATAASGLIGSFGSNLTQVFSDLFSTPNGNWILTAYDDGSGDLGTLTSWSVSITYSSPNFSWSPTTDLYTNSGATTAYTGNPSTVYSKPTANRTYTATATTAAGCSTTASVTINVAAPTTETVASTDYIWKGTTSTAWGTTTNWTQFDGTNYTAPSAAPTSTSVVVIPQNNTCVQNQPLIGSSAISVQDLKIESGATTTLNSGAQLTISGTLTNNGTLTLESGATLVQGSSSTLAGSGTYNVKQAITGDGTTTPSGRFWYLGSPVSLASSSAYFASNAANVVKKRSESTNAWTALSSGSPEPLLVGQGYYTQAIPANSTINFTGGLLNNGAISITNLTRTAGQGFEGFNLVSNPYPSYLDWDAVTKTDVGNTMWYRTHNGTAMVFDTYVAGTGGIGTNLNGNGVSNLIPPMQSFWVRVNPNANPSLNNTGSLGLTNSMRAHFTSINGSVAGLKSTANERDLFLRMNLLQANKKDQLIVYVNEQATNGFDILDGEKMMQAGYPQFYTKAGDKKIVINGLNSAKKQQALPVTIELPTTGVHTFIIEDLEISNGLVWLEDKQEEIIQALEPGTVYEFYANAGLNAERFVLHFQLIDDAVPTNVYNEVNSSANFSGKGASVYAESAGVVVIKLPASAEGVTDIQIRDAAGKLVYAGSMNNLETSVELAQANGIYYVTLSSNTGVEVRKVFIQQ